MEKKSKVPVVLNVFTEEDGIISINLEARRLTGQGWIDRFKNKGIDLGSQVEEILLSEMFVPTNNVYKLIIVRGSKFMYGERTIANAREFAYHSGYFKATLEVACLLRDLISDDKAKEIFLHALVVVSTHAKKEFTDVLGFDVDEKKNSLEKYCVKEILRWRHSTGFVFSKKKIVKHRQAMQ